MIAALYVRRDGPYAGRDDIDAWDESRDAREYPGPWPVIAHSPCGPWGRLAMMHGMTPNEDGGCFAAALAAVERWGGVLEHPHASRAWKHFGLPPAAVDGWNRDLFGRPGWSCEVDQGRYGHQARKRTWLYYVGPPPTVAIDFAPASIGRRAASGRCGVEILSERQRELTPPAFAELLIALARGVAA